MQITIHYTKSDGQLYEWAHDHNQTLDFTVALLRKDFNAVKIMVVIK